MRESCTSRKDIFDTISDEVIATNTNSRALLVIVSSLGDNPLRAIYDCKNAIEEYEEEPSDYASKSVIIKLISL